MAAETYFYNSSGGDRTYNADSFEYWLKKFFTSGVFSGDCAVSAVDGMTVRMAAGYANADGKVIRFDAAEDLTVPAADSQVRVDAVVIERNDNTRLGSVKIVSGTPGGSAPAPVRSGGVYQLVVALITVPIGALSITDANIRDTRADSSLCGVVTQACQTFSFDGFRRQFDAWLEGVTESLDETNPDVSAAAKAETALERATEALAQAGQAVTAAAAAQHEVLLYSPASVAGAATYSLQNDAYKGFDAVRVYLRYHDGKTFYKTTRAGSASYNKSKNKWTVTAPTAGAVDVSWGDHYGGVLVPNGMYVCCVVFGSGGQAAIRHIHYNKDTGTITIGAATVGGSYNARVPYEWYEVNNHFSTKKFSAKKSNGSTTTKTVNYQLDQKAFCYHFAVPFRIYGVNGFVTE